MPVLCVSYGCLNSVVAKPSLSFFKLPTDFERVFSPFRVRRPIRVQTTVQALLLVFGPMTGTHTQTKDMCVQPKFNEK
ncbi:jg390 [Pararge aegeria aegeria]|uniref:Jg390 protein n=1 Tax=Pararge aegeria aegeria TaxID=348720 RepID=A0A8S4QCW0_9NEOP|nr:jg390 [Pararge aegeria aegeria]